MVHLEMVTKDAFVFFFWLPHFLFLSGSLAGTDMRVLSLGGGGLRKVFPLSWERRLDTDFIRKKTTYYESIFLLKID